MFPPPFAPHLPGSRLLSLRPGPRPCLALCLVLSGCHLLDQRDFDASAGRKPVPAAAPAPPPPPPSLVTIRYTVPDPQYRDALAALVAKAIARKPDVLFSVTTLLPGAPGPGSAEHGREVAQTIVDDGALAGQVEQSLRTEPGLSSEEVRVDVR